jgi:hypothetical protein
MEDRESCLGCSTLLPKNPTGAEKFWVEEEQVHNGICSAAREITVSNDLAHSTIAA